MFRACSVTARLLRLSNKLPRSGEGRVLGWPPSQIPANSIAIAATSPAIRPTGRMCGRFITTEE